MLQQAWPILLKIALMLLDQFFVKNPANKESFNKFVQDLRTRGLVDVERRYKSEDASQTLEDRWKEEEKKQ
jgi:hypothetical protein